MKKMLLAAVLTAGMAGAVSAQGSAAPNSYGYLSGNVGTALVTTLAVAIIATAVSEGSSGTN